MPSTGRGSPRSRRRCGLRWEHSSRVQRPSLRRLRPSVRQLRPLRPPLLGLLQGRLRKLRWRSLRWLLRPRLSGRRTRGLDGGLVRPARRRRPPPPRPPAGGLLRSGPQRAHPSPQSPLMQSAIVGHSSVSGGMVQRLCFPVSGCVFVIVCTSIAGRLLSRDRRQFTKAEPPATLLKTYFLAVVVGCRWGGSLRGGVV